MSDRINGFVVVLDKSYKDEDIQSTINAIMQIKGVINVAPNIQNVSDQIAYAKAKAEFVDRIYNALKDL